MEDLASSMNQVALLAKEIEETLNKEVEKMQLKIKSILKGETHLPAIQFTASPQQSKKRAKCLSSIADSEEDSIQETESSSPNCSNNNNLKDLDESCDQMAAEVVAPIPTPRSVKPQQHEHEFVRPARAAKLKSEKCLKEQPLNVKMRRPSGKENTNYSTTSVTIKLENEQRQSQMQSKNNQYELRRNASTISKKSAYRKSDDSIVVVSDKGIPVLEIESGDEEDKGNSNKPKNSSLDGMKNLKILIKREKSSLALVDKKCNATEHVPVSNNANTAEPVKDSAELAKEKLVECTAAVKKSRKKKVPKPVKVERLSNIDAEVTTKNTRNRKKKEEERKQSVTSEYEDAVDNLPNNSKEIQANSENANSSTVNAILNETVTITKNVTVNAPVNATFVSDSSQNTLAVPQIQKGNTNANITVTISSKSATNEAQYNGKTDTTFNVKGDSDGIDNSLITEDESFEKPMPPPVSAKASKLTKLPQKTKELFNPCVQSPLKKKVEAFEIHAQNNLRSRVRTRNTNENDEPAISAVKHTKAFTSSNSTTPVIGKPFAPVLGRFLTPTQASNFTPLLSGNVKKMPNSTSKTMPFPKQASSNLKSTSSTSSSSLTRDNSAEDLKKGYNKLQQLAEERKKAREQKHQLAAQTREAKEKERAERLQKLVKEREEKKRKKELEMEQKKRELEEISRKLKLQDEREKQIMKSKMDAAEIARQERDLLLQIKQPKLPKQIVPKEKSKFTFEMLHEDDPTDDEGISTNHRPSPPSWSTRSARAPEILGQSNMSTAIIDSFFSVQPMTPDLKQIFPNIDEKHLKRNSSVIWQTPPRYSEMPKY